MKSLFLTLTLSLFIFIGSFAQESSLLWKVTGNGLSKPSYIYGTIHLICPQDYSMDEVVKTSFSETEQLFLELDFDDPEMMQNMMALSVMTDGKTAKDYLTDEEYTLLDNKFKSTLGAGMAQLQTLKPLMLLSMSYMSILKCQPMSFETVFVGMAKEENKEVLGLETVEYQFSVFEEIPAAEQFKMIASILNDESAALEEFDALVKMYNSQDIIGLLELMDDSEWNMKKYEDALINNRNIEWAKKFATIAEAKSTFFAVGAGHLAGNKGWLALLKEKGYKVEAVK